jgi:eukaryotic-like serine/threonine-protein kinase
MSQTPQPCMQCEYLIPVELVQCPSCGSPLGSGEAPEAWMGEVLDGKYEVEEILGIGGMGMVFRARRNLINDQVALKILFPKFLKSDLQRRLFRDEALSMAALNDPKVITIFDMAIDSTYGVAYMAMELLEGFTFKELMLSEAPMPPERLYPIFTQVCNGLSAAHQLGIIHRDLKPDNLFLSKAPNGDFNVKILDFGIATVMGQRHSDESNKLLGTLRYMAPEQCRGDAVSPPTDLYALGIILYESLTRQRAVGKSVEAVLYDEVIPINKRLPEHQSIPRDLEALIKRLLAKDSSRRPQSALELKANLEAIADPLSHPLHNHPHLSHHPQGSAHGVRITSELPKIDPEIQEWERREFTPILDADHSGVKVSLLWYIVPASLLLLLLYLISKVF